MREKLQLLPSDRYAYLGSSGRVDRPGHAPHAAGYAFLSLEDTLQAMSCIGVSAAHSGQLLRLLAGLGCPSAR